MFLSIEMGVALLKKDQLDKFKGTTICETQPYSCVVTCVTTVTMTTDKTDSCELNPCVPVRLTNLMLTLKQGVKPEAFLFSSYLKHQQELQSVHGNLESHTHILKKIRRWAFAYKIVKYMNLPD